MTNIAMVTPWPIEIDSLPFLKMVIFHGELLNNQRVYIYNFNGNSRILKWRYVSTICLAIFCGDIPWNLGNLGLI